MIDSFLTLLDFCNHSFRGSKNMILNEIQKFVFPKITNIIRKNNRNHCIILHHNNTRSHTACQTIHYLKGKNIELMSHCPYSPDLLPNDFFLFPYVKENMCRCNFHPSKKTMFSRYQLQSWKTVSRIGLNRWKSV